MENQVDQNLNNINPSATSPNMSLPTSSNLPFPELVVSSPSAKTVALLKNAIYEAAKAGYTFAFGAEQEFYLFSLDEEGKPTKVPHDGAGYMDIAPEDRGENIRREICLTLEQMGIRPESSHHEQGPGQNEIDFRYSDALMAADNAMTFQTIVKTIARQNGLFADFSAKPLEDQPGNGFHINMSVKPNEKEDLKGVFITGTPLYEEK